jgi:NitT/TauT family transport system ATP-binding protein
MTVRRRNIDLLPLLLVPARAAPSLDLTILQRLGTAIAPGHYPAQTGESMAPGEQNTQGGGRTPTLAVDNVTLQYKTEQHLVTATFRVGFEVFEGERFVLLGPSGCGKSTLLKAVAGFMQPVEGRITLNGREIKQPGSDRMMVFQEFDQLLPWKTVLGNVLFPLLVNRKMPKEQAIEHARALLAKVNLSRFENIYPHMLSGGMKQRVAIARALAMEPAVLLMDEPFAALDALTRRKMQEELKALWDDVRFTVLFVTHSIEEALLVGSRILVLSPHPGRVKAELNADHLDFGDIGTPAFEQLHRRIHDLLFADRIETALVTETHNG